MAHDFDAVFEAEYRPLRAYLYRRLRSADADDLAAETFTIAYRRWDEIDPSASARPWLYGIAANLLRHHSRKERRMLRAYALSIFDSAHVDADDASVARADARAQQRALAGALAELRLAEREVLLLHAWADLTDSEIAEALSLPIGTVKSRMHRARERIRNRLAACGQVEVEAPALTAEEQR